MKTLLCVLPVLNQLSPLGVLCIEVAGNYSQVLSDAPRSSCGMTSPG